MNNLIEAVGETVTFLKKKEWDAPVAAIVLGTGLGELISHTTIKQSVAYSDIPHFPVATVEFHKGNLLYGKIGQTTVMIMQGRFHYYEGYTMQQITFPIRVMKAMGAKYLFLSNAAGGLHPEFRKGDLVLISDHINLQPENPLRGVNDPNAGPRFPDMSRPYNEMLKRMLKTESDVKHTVLKEGVYAAVSGPNLETRAEYRFLRMIGADMVGMSTVPEVIVANQIGLPSAAISVITDECDPENLQPVDINDIIATAKEADKKLSLIFAGTIAKLTP
ncbi:MAG: purine-nucleoside phosphorylase [Chitinophagaceae bacterium]|nr:MAG: purine-nucleoside phosphorylase [Chitinophagaceae bacterium]